MRHFLVYGTHPAISQAEATAVFGISPRMVGSSAMAILETEAWDAERIQDRLAGVIKLGDVIEEVPAKKLTAALLTELLLARPREERVLFGMSIYTDSRKEAEALKRLPILLKRRLQDAGKSVRWVSGDNGVLSPAAVAKVKLTSEGYDLVIGIKDGTAHIGLTSQVQNADAWSERDYGRPFRDMKTGMLPPKLARIMLNLGLGGSVDGESDGLALIPNQRRLLDPFCGGGTILMEAALLTQHHLPSSILSIQGSDIDAKQTNGAKRNLDWLVEKNILSQKYRERVSLSDGDARAVHLRHTAESVTNIITEGHLGPPIRGTESAEMIRRNASDLEKIWRESLGSFAKVQPVGGRVVCVWPAFRTTNGTAGVDLMNELRSFGYRLAQVPLPYRRPDQHVQRNIVVLERVDLLPNKLLDPK